MVDTITQLITRTLELDEAATTQGRTSAKSSLLPDGSYVVTDRTNLIIAHGMSESDAILFAEYRTAAPLLANEVKRLQDLHRPRDTRKGEWPEEGQSILWWSDSASLWASGVFYGSDYSSGIVFWLPAPPSPEGD